MITDLASAIAEKAEIVIEVRRCIIRDAYRARAGATIFVIISIGPPTPIAVRCRRTHSRNRG